MCWRTVSTGVVVELLADLDGDGIPETVVATDTTDADGNYFFDMLPEGTYAVNVPNGTGWYRWCIHPG